MFFVFVFRFRFNSFFLLSSFPVSSFVGGPMCRLHKQYEGAEEAHVALQAKYEAGKPSRSVRLAWVQAMFSH
jgi:hypothetical protein